MADFHEAYARYFMSPLRQTDLSAAEASALSYAHTFDALGGLDDEVDNVMRRDIKKKVELALSGCAMAIVSAEYLYPLAAVGWIPRNPLVASGRTVVLDLHNGLDVVRMPFRPDLLDEAVEWTGVGLLARIADMADLDGERLRLLHDELNLVPEVAIPLSNNFIEISRLPDAA